MKKFALFGLLLLTVAFLFGCTNEEPKNNLPDESSFNESLEEDLIEDNEINTGNVFDNNLTENNLTLPDELVDENQEVLIGEII